MQTPSRNKGAAGHNRQPINLRAKSEVARKGLSKNDATYFNKNWVTWRNQQSAPTKKHNWRGEHRTTSEPTPNYSSSRLKEENRIIDSRQNQKHHCRKKQSERNS